MPNLSATLAALQNWCASVYVVNICLCSKDESKFINLTFNCFLYKIMQSSSIACDCSMKQMCSKRFCSYLRQVVKTIKLSQLYLFTTEANLIKFLLLLRFALGGKSDQIHNVEYVSKCRQTSLPTLALSRKHNPISNSSHIYPGC